MVLQTILVIIFIRIVRATHSDAHVFCPRTSWKNHSGYAFPHDLLQRQMQQEQLIKVADARERILKTPTFAEAGVLHAQLLHCEAPSEPARASSCSSVSLHSDDVAGRAVAIPVSADAAAAAAAHAASQ